MEKTKNIQEDIQKLEDKKKVLTADYPRTYLEIAKKYKVSIQYIFRVRKSLVKKG